MSLFMRDAMEIFTSLGPLFPPLQPALATLKVVLQMMAVIQENRAQCEYLVRRSAAIFEQVHLSVEKEDTRQVSMPFSVLQSAIERLHDLIQQLSRMKRIESFLQREEIARKIRSLHQDLDNCIELFHLQCASTLVFGAAENERAHREDQAAFRMAVDELLKNDKHLIDALNLQGHEIRDAIRGLHNAISRGFGDDPASVNFARSSLHTLSITGAGPQMELHEWAISELEIMKDPTPLGSGSFGKVYSGRWQGAQVAVKELPDTSLQVLNRQINIWKNLCHPHVAAFYKACMESTPPCLVSELHPHGNAIDYLSNHPGVNRVKICHEIALGMQYLHKQNVVHGDLKPGNVLIDNKGSARINDFGLSKLQSSSASSRTKKDGPIVGTVAFMAPERMRSGAMNRSTDVYAFSMTVYQILTDIAPFSGLSSSEIRDSVLSHKARPERPEEDDGLGQDMSDDLWKLTTRCWSDDRKIRPNFAEIASQPCLEFSSTPTANLPLQTVTLPFPTVNMPSPTMVLPSPTLNQPSPAVILPSPTATLSFPTVTLPSPTPPSPVVALPTPPTTTTLPSYIDEKILVLGDEPPLSPSDMVVLIMGPSGSGKSTFIETLIGESTGIGHQLHSETATIAIFHYNLPNGKRLCLVDSPGFGDTRRPDADVLETLASWLAATYKAKIFLTGILFFQRISDNRITGTMTKNLEILHKLCGDECLQNVVLVTTMWSEVVQSKGEERERELLHQFWKPLVDRHSQVARFNKTRPSALDVVRCLDQKEPLALHIQREMVDRGTLLKETAVGRVLFNELEIEIERQKNALRTLKAQMQKEDKETRKITVEEIEKREEDRGRAKEWRKVFTRALWKSLGDKILRIVRFRLR